MADHLHEEWEDLLVEDEEIEEKIRGVVESINTIKDKGNFSQGIFVYSI